MAWTARIWVLQAHTAPAGRDAQDRRRQSNTHSYTGGTAGVARSLIATGLTTPRPAPVALHTAVAQSTAETDSPLVSIPTQCESRRLRARADQGHGSRARSTTPRGEEVHHKNGIRHDNRPSNLELWARSVQPPGCRVSDLVESSVRILRLYRPDLLAECTISEADEQLPP